MSDTESRLAEQLAALKLVAVAEQYATLAAEAAQKQWLHVDYLARLVDSEAQRRHQLAIQRRIAAARFPGVKTLDQFDWNWPKKINRLQVQNLFRLVLFTTAVDIINTLTAAQTVGRLKNELKHYLRPTVLAVDELGYLPIDKAGADLLFQVISQRYEQGSIVLTTNQPYKHWPKVFNNDSTLTSAVLDRLLHHAETVIIEGKSYRMKDQIETP